MQKLLAGIHSLADLPAVSDRLGSQPWFEEVASPFTRSDRDRETAVVGRRGDFIWYGTSGPGAEASARKIASQLARAGECSGVLALDPSARRLAIAVSELPVPCRVVDLDRPAPIDLTALSRIPGSGDGPPVAVAGRIAEALRLEDAGFRFFRAFRNLLGRMADEVKDYTGPGSREQLSLLQLTRILFLYFVQSKGWLDGRRGFLREEMDRCLAAGRHLHRQFLKPLFFGTLNLPASSRGAPAHRFGNIPFLNGGLFEPHPLERGWRGVLPNALLCSAFDDVFERFAFTVHESDRPDTIAPDMLGRVFEGVMAPAHRKDSGSFYTPAELVDRVVDQALMAYLAQRHGIERARARELLDHPGETTAKLLGGIRLLDPAVGSGAFLVGALERLTALHHPERLGRHRIRRRILATLHGVDRDAMAVRITELRLWLAVIADDPARIPKMVRPLPNLDCLVRQGDSLLTPSGWMGQLPSRGQLRTSSLAAFRRTFLDATGSEKAAAGRELRKEEHSVACRRVEWAESAMESALRQSVSDARAPDLFGRQAGMGGAGRKSFLKLRQRWHSARTMRRQLREDRAGPWFQYEVQFGDIVGAGKGFDIVIGNPPWVRAERLPARLREHLSERYRWWRAAGERGVRHQPDLSIAFLERGLELAAPDGIVAFLLPAKITSAGYAETARRAIRARYCLHAVARLASEDEGTFTAAVYPLLLVVGKGLPAPDHPVAISIAADSEKVPVSDIPPGGPWVLRGADLARIHARLREMPGLGQHFRARLGVKTGANEVFLNPAAQVEAELLRPVMRGRDLSLPKSSRTGQIVWTHDSGGRPLVSLPAGATRWFNRHHRELTGRNDYRSGPIWQLFRTEGLQTPWRVVWADLARALRPVVTGDDVIPLNTCYYIGCNELSIARALAAWLGSRWIRSLAALSADPARGGYARFNARCIEGLPWFAEAIANPVLISSQDQEETDDTVAGYLGLSAAERGALEGVG